MKKDKLIAVAVMTMLPFMTSATEINLKDQKLNNGKEIQIQARCNNWSLNCLLDKIVSSGTTSLLGPGVSGDP